MKQSTIKAGDTLASSMAADEWRPALVAFYRADCSFQRAANVGTFGFPLDGTDLRTIEAIRAAIEVAP